MTQALVSQQASFPSPQEIAMLKDLGAMAVKSGFLPTSIKTPEQAVIIMLKGRELGIPPMQAFGSIAVVNGKPTISAELMVSLIYQRIPGAVIDVIETNANRCVIEAARPGGKRTTFEFNMEDAKRAQLTGKGPWITYPAAMLRARCISAMARMMFADALSGACYTPEEMGAEVLDESEAISTEARAVTAAEVTPLVKPLAQPAVKPQETAKEPPKSRSRAEIGKDIMTVAGEIGLSDGDMADWIKERYQGKGFKQITNAEMEDFLGVLEGEKLMKQEGDSA